jgi:AcrR family transcriptional regulator
VSSEHRRAGLLRAARTVFGRKGYHAAGVSDIVGEAGVARGTFYNYFESKRAVFQAVLLQLMDEVAGVVVPIELDRSIEAQLHTNLELIVTAALNEEVGRLLFAEAAGIDDEADAALRAFYGAAAARIEKALRKGVQLGLVRDGDLGLTARCLLGMVQMPVFMASLGFEERLAPKRLVDELEALLRGGVLA